MAIEGVSKAVTAKMLIIGKKNRYKNTFLYLLLLQIYNLNNVGACHLQSSQVKSIFVHNLVMLIMKNGIRCQQNADTSYIAKTVASQNKNKNFLQGYPSEKQATIIQFVFFVVLKIK